MYYYNLFLITEYFTKIWFFTYFISCISNQDKIQDPYQANVIQIILCNYLDLDELLASKMIRCETGDFMCLECPYTHKTRQRLKYHIESKHILSPGHICEFCQKVCPTKNALCLHRSRYHKNI